MTKLDSVDPDELRSALETAESAKAAKRLVVALAYLDGVDVGTIQERYGFAQSTIYYWLDRIDTRPLEDALEDESRPGRPAKLSDEQLAEVESLLDEASDDVTAETLQKRILDTYGVKYSVPHVRRRFLND